MGGFVLHGCRNVKSGQGPRRGYKPLCLGSQAWVGLAWPGSARLSSAWPRLAQLGLARPSLAQLGAVLEGVWISLNCIGKLRDQPLANSSRILQILFNSDEFFSILTNSDQFEK